MFAWRLRTVFGITPTQYEQMLEAQGQACAICQRTEPTGYNWHVDHCHATGKVRGVLCSMCNHALGLLQDNPSLLRKAAEYIESN